MIPVPATDCVYLAGNGWGAIAACKGLLRASFEVSLFENDPDLEILGAKAAPVSMEDLEGAVIVFAGYKRVVPVHILDKNVCINVHYSLLPKYRGFHSTVWAILNDEPELGLTVHLMNEFIDDGPILAQYRVKNDSVSTSTHYMQLFNSYVADHLGEILRDYIKGSIKPQPQDKSLASWVGKRNLDDCRIDFNQPIRYLKAFFRVLVSPYPHPFFEFHGERYWVTKVRFFDSAVVTHTGRILNIDDEGIWIKVGDGYMIVSEMVDDEHNTVETGRFKLGQFLNR